MRRYINNKHYGIIIFIWAILILALANSPITEAGELSKGQSVYVPIYSHIYSGDREHPFLLTAILSIRNTDSDHNITILTVDYFDSDGKLLRNYVEKPESLGPMASKRYVVGESDKGGGSGAKFIVKWQSSAQVNPPIIEGVMIGTKMQQGISFVSRGQPLHKSESKQ
jgi:hypothetical protein